MIRSRAQLSDPAYPEHGIITISFPILDSEYDRVLVQFFDYERYEQQKIMDGLGQFDDLGHVSYYWTVPIEELPQRDPAEQLEREMEGMM